MGDAQQAEEDTWVIQPGREGGTHVDGYGRSARAGGGEEGDDGRHGAYDRRERWNERCGRGSGRENGSGSGSGTEERGSTRIGRSVDTKGKSANEARLFVAILVDDATRLHLCALPISHIPKRRAADDRAYHITLGFVGAAEHARVDAALRTVQAEPFEMQLKGVGAFPSRRRPLTLWAGVARNDALTRLQRAVRAALVEEGFRMDSRPYVAHVTLAWVLDSQLGVDAAADFLHMNEQFEANRFRVGEFVLMETLRAGCNESGSHGRYAVRQRYRLRERGEWRRG